MYSGMSPKGKGPSAYNGVIWVQVPTFLFASLAIW